jgi:hypothetical protein
MSGAFVFVRFDSNTRVHAYPLPALPLSLPLPPPSSFYLFRLDPLPLPSSFALISLSLSFFLSLSPLSQDANVKSLLQQVGERPREKNDQGEYKMWDQRERERDRERCRTEFDSWVLREGGHGVGEIKCHRNVCVCVCVRACVCRQAIQV